MKTLIPLVIVATMALFLGCDGIQDAATPTETPSEGDVLVTAQKSLPGADEDAVDADLSEEPATPRYSYVVVLADTHIEDPDAEEIEHVRAIGEEIAKMPWPIEAVFVLGDVCYLLPYTTFQEFLDDPDDRYDMAEEAFAEYPVPVYPLIGNHDMDNGPEPWVELADELFAHHFGVDPYYAVDIGGWRFLALDNFKGPTHVVGDPEYDYDSGSLGADQLAWMEDQLADGKPTILMSHFPPFIIKDLPPFMYEHRDQVRLMLAGHSHAWMNLGDFFGVPAMVVGTTQWDADCLMILELDNELGTWRMLNWDAVQWGSGYSLPWDEE